MTQQDLFDASASVSARAHVCPMCKGSGELSDEAYKRLVEDRPGAVGRTHPITSRDAARRPSNRIRFDSQRYRVLKALRDLGPSTAAKVAAIVGLSRNQTATRLGELREIGFVARKRDGGGDLVTAPTGRCDEGAVQEITESGLAALSAAGR